MMWRLGVCKQSEAVWKTGAPRASGRLRPFRGRRPNARSLGCPFAIKPSGNRNASFGGVRRGGANRFSTASRKPDLGSHPVNANGSADSRRSLVEAQSVAQSQPAPRNCRPHFPSAQRMLRPMGEHGIVTAPCCVILTSVLANMASMALCCSPERRAVR
jgi:hypothetical protein